MPQGRYRDLLHPAVQVRAGTGAPRDVAARQVAPGRYEATVVADAAETLTVSTEGGGGEGGSNEAGAMTRTIVPDPVAEYRFGAPDEALLEGDRVGDRRRLAADTGGARQCLGRPAHRAPPDVAAARGGRAGALVPRPAVPPHPRLRVSETKSCSFAFSGRP